MTHIDIGAYVGIFTWHMARDAKRVIAFEPDPDTLAILRANVGYLGNVEIVPAAAGVENGSVSLHRHPRHGEGELSSDNSVIVGNPLVAGGEVVQVRRVDFLRYVEELGEDIGVVKVDIEGAEVELLEALFARPDVLVRIRNLFVETHEHIIPGLAGRVEKLRHQARRIQGAKINLDGPRRLRAQAIL